MNPPHPRDLARPAAGLLVGGVKAYLKGLSWYERQVMTVLRARMDALPPADPDVHGPPAESERPLPDRMRELLDRALEQDRRSGEGDLHSALLGQLVPDEARILAALSGGDAAPLVHVYAWSRAGLLGEPVLEDATLVGRTAGLALPDRAPVYVRHLRALGLVEVGPEAPELKTEYEILLAQDDVRAAVKQASVGPVAPRVSRHALRLSSLGHELWRACDPSAAS